MVSLQVNVAIKYFLTKLFGLELSNQQTMPFFQGSLLSYKVSIIDIEKIGTECNRDGLASLRRGQDCFTHTHISGVIISWLRILWKEIAEK